MTRPLMPLPSSGRSGAEASATSTSPFGSTYTQRGCCRPVANAATRVPAAAFGVTPVGQPFAGAIFTVGMSVLLGSGRVGLGPVSAPDGNFDISLQAER